MGHPQSLLGKRGASAAIDGSADEIEDAARKRLKNANDANSERYLKAQQILREKKQYSNFKNKAWMEKNGGPLI